MTICIKERGGHYHSLSCFNAKPVFIWFIKVFLELLKAHEFILVPPEVYILLSEGSTIIISVDSQMSSGC